MTLLKSVQTELDKTSTHVELTDSWICRRIPKKAYFYWGSESMSYLRYLTLYSFSILNKDWELILIKPKSVVTGRSWKNRNNLDNVEYRNSDHSTKLLEIPNLSIYLADFSGTVVEAASEPHRSDYIRWAILSELGGFWSDMDILFLRSMDEIYLNSEAFTNLDTLVSFDRRHRGRKGRYEMSIGALMSGGGGNALYSHVFEAAKNVKSKDDYQNFGTLLFDACDVTSENYANKFNNLSCENLHEDVFYLKDYKNLKDIYHKDCLTEFLTNDKSVGIHWYGGAIDAIKANNTISDSRTSDIPNTLTSAISYIMKKR